MIRKKIFFKKTFLYLFYRSFEINLASQMIFSKSIAALSFE